MTSSPESEKLIKALRASVSEIEALRKRNAELVAAGCEPLAIIATSCRFPGRANSPEELWQLVSEGRDAITPLPRDRGWNIDALYDADANQPGKTYTRGGGFLDGIDRFDAGLFGISPREAASMDPQQRLLLELTWEALERGGIPPTSLDRSLTGVFVGVCYDDYKRLGPSTDVAEDGYSVLGNAYSVVSGRIAYVLGLQGPTLTVDTACSTGLVALHLAGASLRNHECNLAIVGGATVFPTSDPFVYFSRLKTLSPDGRCKAFSNRADGAGWAEGGGVLVLERLSDALTNGHRVLGLVRGSAINQDGRSQGLTAPNGPSQERVIRASLENAKLDGADVDVIEAHGTGTALGDPIEVQAIQATYGRAHSSERPLWLGTVKSNIGHTQAASGIAGIVKMIMAMAHEQLPPSLHVEALSTHVDWSPGTVRVLTESVEWRRDPKRPRRAGVSSFGIAGTNAHVILEEPPAAESTPHPTGVPAPPHVPLLLSGQTDEAVRAQALAVRSLDAAPLDVAWSLVTTRSLLGRRAALAIDSLDRVDDTQLTIVSARPAKLALLFTGQGAQQLGMGRQLREIYSVFRDAIDDICTRFDVLLDKPLMDVMFGEDRSLLDQTAFTQPALFALEVSLFRMLAAWGIEPEFLLGHSIGELAAAHVAGVFSLDDACKLVAARGRLMQALPGGGAMVSIQASEQEVLAVLEQHVGVDIAGLNGPMSTVISGDEAAVIVVGALFEARGRRVTRLSVSHAFHSWRMDAMLDDFAKVAESVSYSPPTMQIVSNVTGELATADELCSPAYWVRQVRSPVRFLDGVQTLEAHGVGICLELGPHGTLSSMVPGCLSPGSEDKIALVSALRRERPESETIASALGELSCRGTKVDWSAYFAPFGPQRVELPTYAFQRQRYWLESTDSITDMSTIGLERVAHPLLGAGVSLADADGYLFTATLSLVRQPWLADHTVFEHVLFPGTGFLDLALSVGAHVGTARVEELSISAPLALARASSMSLQVWVGKDDVEGRRSLTIHSRSTDARRGEPWTLHATGTLADGESAPNFDLEHWPPPGASETVLEGVYEQLASLGLDYGPTFRGLVKAWTVSDVRYAEVRLPDDASVDGFAIHPALLDAALHVLVDKGRDTVSLPFAWSGVSLHATGATGLRVRLRPAGSQGAFELDVADTGGRPLATVVTLTTRPALAADIREALANVHTRHLYRIEWRSLPPFRPQSHALVVQLGGEAIVGATVVDSLDAIEQTPDLVLLPCLGEVSPLEATVAVLEVLQRWLASDRMAASRLVIVTHRAVSTGDDTIEDLGHAPVWGLVRSAQAENPDLPLVIVDVDDMSTTTWLEALGSGEPQLAVRNGQVLIPRLVPVRVAEGEVASRLDAEGTVLVTGGTGALGRLLAHHLVDQHGVRHLLLISRGGLESPGAGDLRDELQVKGATVTIAACDVANFEAAAALLDSIPVEHPLVGVFHAAGVLDDGLIAGLTRERLEHVFRPKVDAARHLHELTKDRSLAVFVLFSSVAGVFGSPGQGNYAAANVFLDALCVHRRAQGLPAVSLAWGAWAQGGMAARLSQADKSRLERIGLPLMPAAEGLRLLDVALTRTEPNLVPVRLDFKALAERDDLPRLLSALVRSGPRRAGSEVEIPTRVQSMEDLERAIRHQTSSVLGHIDPGALDLTAPIESLGLDSLMIMDLRTRLGKIANERLPIDFIYEHATLEELIDGLGARMGLDHPPAVVEPAREESLKQGLRRMNASEREQRIFGPVYDQVARILGREQIPEGKSLRELGVDDVMGAELCLTLQRLIGVRVLPRETLDGVDIGGMIKRLASFFDPYQRVHQRRELAELDTLVESPYDTSAEVGVTPVSDQEVLFVLSPPRSGSTLLRVMLAGHSRLFSPQELHLAPFSDMARYDHHLNGTVLNMGLIYTIAEVISRTGAWTLYREWIRDAVPTSEIYKFFGDRIGDKVLVDKSPFFFPPRKALDRIALLFPRARFLHLLRHPASVIESYVRERFHALHDETKDLDPFDNAEWVWTRCNQAILDFQRQNPGRVTRIYFEDLATDPEQTMRRICPQLGLEFEGELLNPYSGHKMVAGGFQIGDPNFVKHKSILPEKADLWREIQLPWGLQAETEDLAKQLGYELPDSEHQRQIAKSRSKSISHAMGGLGIETDAILPDDIAIKDGAYIEPGTVPKHDRVLLTGATGFLGAFLLVELMTKTAANVVCIVRADNDADARQRVLDNLNRYKVLDALDPERLEVLAGNLEWDGLGLEESKLTALNAEIDIIYHCGAQVSWLLPYRKLRESNVGGLRRILRLASRDRSIPVHYVSSIGSALIRPFEAEQMVEEVTAQTGLGRESIVELPLGYFESKWVGARMVKQARERGLTISSYSPGLIAGHSQTGVDSLSSSQFVHALIKGSTQLGVVSDTTGWRLTPVDRVARDVVAVSKLPEGQAVDVYLDSAVSMMPNDVLDILLGHGYDVRMGDYSVWRQRVLDLANQSDTENALFGFTDVIYTFTPLRMIGQEYQLDWYRANRTAPDVVREALGDRNLVDRALLQRLIDFYVEADGMPPKPNRSSK